MLQKEFKEYLEFCLDVDFYKNCLNDMNSTNRYEMFCNHVKEVPMIRTFKEELIYKKTDRLDSDKAKKFLMI